MVFPIPDPIEEHERIRKELKDLAQHSPFGLSCFTDHLDKLMTHIAKEHYTKAEFGLIHIGRGYYIRTIIWNDQHFLKAYSEFQLL